MNEFIISRSVFFIIKDPEYYLNHEMICMSNMVINVNVSSNIKSGVSCHKCLNEFLQFIFVSKTII